MEVVEGRARWLVLVIGLVAIWNSFGGASFVQLGTWVMAIYMASMFSLVSAFGAVVLALAPGGADRLALVRREQLVYGASVLLTIALILIAIRASHGAFEANQGRGPFG